jgi:hypothetical protein
LNIKKLFSLTKIFSVFFWLILNFFGLDENAKTLFICVKEEKRLKIKGWIKFVALKNASNI